MYLLRHKHAAFYLMGLSFLEAFILPIPPAMLQVPLTFANSERAVRYCVFAIFGSIVGSIVGYMVGAFFIKLLIPVLMDWGYYSHFLIVQTWMRQWGLYILFIMSLSPSPYKLTTIASGAVGIGFVPFVLVAGFARILHFSAVAFIIQSRHMQSVKRFVLRRYSAKLNG